MRSNSPPAATANDRFKRGFGSWFWLGLLAATLGHTALFLFFPSIGLDPVAVQGETATYMALPEPEMPEPPPEIQPPAAPVLGVDLEGPDVTIPKTTYDAFPTRLLPPPPGSGDDDLSKGPTFVPTTVAPRLENSDEVARLLQRFYPPMLRDAGIGGTVSVWFFIDENGRVVRTQVNESSGYGDLDAAALEVADRLQFSPAWNRDKRVPVWVSLPIVFEVGG
jgi:protein TonB